jgi:hypothetical protein
MADDKILSCHKKIINDFKENPIYATYKNQKEGKKENEIYPKEIYKKIIDKNTEIMILDKVKLIYDLSINLNDLSTIDDIINMGGVATVADLLKDENSQIRKYSANILSSLATSMKAQLIILTTDILSIILSLLDVFLFLILGRNAKC